jgi:hypothetical protein
MRRCDHERPPRIVPPPTKSSGNLPTACPQSDLARRDHAGQRGRCGLSPQKKLQFAAHTVPELPGVLPAVVLAALRGRLGLLHDVGNEHISEERSLGGGKHGQEIVIGQDAP